MIASDVQPGMIFLSKDYGNLTWLFISKIELCENELINITFLIHYPQTNVAPLLCVGKYHEDDKLFLNLLGEEGT